MNQLFGLQHRNRVRCAFDFILSNNYPRNLWSCGDNSCYDQADSNSSRLGL